TAGRTGARVYGPPERTSAARHTQHHALAQIQPHFPARCGRTQRPQINERARLRARGYRGDLSTHAAAQRRNTSWLLPPRRQHSTPSRRWLLGVKIAPATSLRYAVSAWSSSSRPSPLLSQGVIIRSGQTFESTSRSYRLRCNASGRLGLTTSG